MSIGRKLKLILILVALSIFWVILYAPGFLLYSSQYEKVDAVVLLLGPDFQARKKEAYDLINKGMADFLIIPAYDKTYRVFDKGTIKYLMANSPEQKTEKNNNNDPLRFHEDTHLEIIEAKKAMSNYELNSAIFVSSPYHMRRIKIIVLKEFDENGGVFYFVPTPYEKAPARFWELSLNDWKKVAREYGKILWFYIYS